MPVSYTHLLAPRGGLEGHAQRRCVMQFLGVRYGIETRLVQLALESVERTRIFGGIHGLIGGPRPPFEQHRGTRRNFCQIASRHEYDYNEVFQSESNPHLSGEICLRSVSVFSRAAAMFRD